MHEIAFFHISDLEAIPEYHMLEPRPWCHMCSRVRSVSDILKSGLKWKTLAKKHQHSSSSLGVIETSVLPTEP